MPRSRTRPRAARGACRPAGGGLRGRAVDRAVHRAPVVRAQSAENQRFTYDGQNRLASAWTPSSGSCATTPTVAGLGGPAPYWTDYAIDPVGNRLSTTSHTAAGNTTDAYAYPAAGSTRPHAVTSVARTSPSGSTTTSTYGYDATGNTTARAVAGSTAQSLTWDAEGRLATVKQGSATSSYVYTAGGDRLVRRQSGTTTVYLPGGQELTLTTATATVTGIRYYSFAGQTIAVRTGQAGSTVSSLVSDPHQTATVSIGNTTQVVTKRRVDPFGNVRGTKPTWPGDHAFLNKPLDTSGLSSVGARYYDASLGRFISVDPVMDLGSPQQWAAYSYADNNPITYWDPTGLFSWGKAWKSANQWVKKHQAEIVGVVVGTVVTSACLAASWGVGSVGCAAMGGAAGGAASNLWRSFKQKTQKFSWGSFAIETGVGALSGAAGGALGKGLVSGASILRSGGSAAEASVGAVRGARTAIADAGRDVSRAASKVASTARSAFRRVEPASSGPATAGDFVGPLTRAESEGFQKTVSDPNKMHHIFGQEEHGFDDLVTAVGSREAVVEQMHRGLQGEVLTVGRFAVERMVGGSTVHVDGMMISDIPRISTAWVMP